MVIQAKDLLTTAELALIDDLINNEVFDGKAAEPFASCDKAARRLQVALMSQFYCQHRIAHHTDHSVSSSFMALDLHVDATCETKAEAVATSALVFWREAIKAGL